MFDTHSHLNFKAYNDDAQVVAHSMAEAGINSIVVGCDTTTSRYAIDLAQTFTHLWASVGIHPIHVLDDPWQTPVMKDLALEERVVAIGEVGLDFFRVPDDPAEKAQYIDAQYVTFREAIRLAQSLEKPLIIHSREAYDEIIEVLKEFYPSGSQSGLNGTVHCYMGNWSQAKQLLDLGFCLGFTGIVTYQTVEPSLVEVITQMPMDRILIETDAPYLTPEPYRTDGKRQTGKIPRNQPQYVREVARKISEIRQIPLDEFIAQTEINAQGLFNL